MGAHDDDADLSFSKPRDGFRDIGNLRPMEFTGDNACQVYGGYISMEESMMERFACDKRKMMMRKVK